jgi:hypothetical protein
MSTGKVTTSFRVGPKKPMTEKRFMSQQADVQHVIFGTDGIAAPGFCGRRKAEFSPNFLYDWPSPPESNKSGW